MLLKDKEEAKLSLSLLWWRTGGTELQLQSYQTSALDGIDWSTSCSGYFTPGKEPPHPLNWRVSVSRADVDIYTKILFKQTWNKLQTLQPSLTRDNRTRSQALFHYFRPNTFFSHKTYALFFSQQLQKITLQKAYEFVYYRVPLPYVTAKLAWKKKKRKSSVFITALHYNAIHTLFIMLHTRTHYMSAFFYSFNIKIIHYVYKL